MKIKICGITRLEDALLSSELGAWAIGFVFFDKSRRFIKPADARKITDRLSKEVKKVGVFVNPSKEYLQECIEVSGINVIQLHGEETPEFCKSLNTEVIKMINLKTEDDLELPLLYPMVSQFLIDANDEGLRGGTGKRADWKLAAQMAEKFPSILAGGLTPENVAKAIKIVKPWGVDVSSGVEDAAGMKSDLKLRKFFQAVKAIP